MSAFSLSRPLAYAAVAISMLPMPAFAQSKEVNIYTTREPGLIQPMLDAFQEKTGIKANSVFIKEGLGERVKAEGQNSPADLLIAVDIGNLKDLVDQGVTQPIVSKVLDSEVPANLRAADHSWTSLTLRARVFYTSKDRVKDTNITYEDLADPKWKGKVCIRSGKHPYNVAMIAAFIAKHGEAKTEEWLKGVKANLARKAAGGDRDVARDILGGICDIGPANSYYVGLMRTAKEDEQRKWGEAINVLFPTFSDGVGTHVNVSGAALAKNAPNKDNAIALLDFLASPDVQKLYADDNFEYPIVGEPNPTIKALGTLKVDSLSLTEIASHRKLAAELIDRVGFDN
ncbi:Fe(3+) ABC transporter substrate-binding protein [Flaviflagellibacter deserti]|uniref:Fe(3+) ABC transporter substrate-binding protein n=1 Tax=Flaviflagellibacter deserti TaxID=2267266 RepID=A0ABV9Z0H9_9HYPH